VYRTGDLVRKFQGKLLFLGRGDQQVKIGGFRVLPEELEQLMLRVIPEAREALVLCGDRRKENKILMAWLVAGKPYTREDVSKILADHLPAAVIPAVELCSSLPRNNNGKIDRQKLRDLADKSDQVTEKGEVVSPGPEGQMRALWHQVLGGSPPGLFANFFSLGGSSLQSLRLTALVNETFGATLETRDLFAFPVLRDYTRLIAGHKNDSAASWLSLKRSQKEPGALYLFSGAGGGPEDFLHLSRIWESGPVRVGNTGSDFCADQLVSHYSEQLFRSGNKEIILGGHSLGGILAFNIAYALEKMGQTTRLVLFETYLSLSHRDRVKLASEKSGRSSLVSGWWSGLRGSGILRGSTVRFFASSHSKSELLKKAAHKDLGKFSGPVRDFWIPGDHQSILKTIEKQDLSQVWSDQERELSGAN